MFAFWALCGFPNCKEATELRGCHFTAPSEPGEGTAGTGRHGGILPRGRAAGPSLLAACSRSGAGRDNGRARWGLLFALCSAVVVTDGSREGANGENVRSDAQLCVAVLWHLRRHISLKQLLFSVFG